MFLPYIDMNQLWIYMCSLSQSPLPPPSPSLWVFPVHQPWSLVSCIQPGLVICFTLDSILVSMLKELEFEHGLSNSDLGMQWGSIITTHSFCEDLKSSISSRSYTGLTESLDHEGHWKKEMKNQPIWQNVEYKTWSFQALKDYLPKSIIPWGLPNLLPMDIPIIKLPPQ